MQTRSRKTSEAIIEPTASTIKEASLKSVKRAKTTITEEAATPSKVQNSDALVENILKTVQKTKSPNATSPGNGNQLKGNDKLPAAEKTKLPKLIKNPLPKAIRGQPKSGRPWKDVKQKFSKIKKSVHRRTFEKKEELRSELKHIKELSKSIREDKRIENVEKKNVRAENTRRRLVNERKNEVVQIIKNPAKLKRMKKKALRKIEKRDLTNDVNGPKVI